MIFISIPRGLMARIPGFHPGGPGSIPGVGDIFFHVHIGILKKKFFTVFFFRLKHKNKFEE